MEATRNLDALTVADRRAEVAGILTLGLENVPVHVAKDLEPEQIRTFRIA